MKDDDNDKFIKSSLDAMKTDEAKSILRSTTSSLISLIAQKLLILVLI